MADAPHQLFVWPGAAASGGWWQSAWFIWPTVIGCFAAIIAIGVWAASANVAPGAVPNGSYLALLSDAADSNLLASGQSINWITAQYIALNVANDVAVGCARLASAGELAANGALIAATPVAVSCVGWVYWTANLMGPVAAAVGTDGTITETPYTPTTAPAGSDRHAAWVIINAPNDTAAREIMFTVGFAILAMWTLPATYNALVAPTA